MTDRVDTNFERLEAMELLSHYQQDIWQTLNERHALEQHAAAYGAPEELEQLDIRQEEELRKLLEEQIYQLGQVQTSEHPLQALAYIMSPQEPDRAEPAYGLPQPGLGHDQDQGQGQGVLREEHSSHHVQAPQAQSEERNSVDLIDQAHRDLSAGKPETPFDAVERLRYQARDNFNMEADPFSQEPDRER